MSLEDELRNRVSDIVRSRWSYVDARVVPETKSIGLGNVGKKLEAAVFYADLDGSTSLVDSYSNEFSAEVYKSFHVCAGRIIRAHGGEVRSFDGDRQMAIFLGAESCTTAVIAALKLNWAVINIIRPALSRQYPNLDYKLKHTVGIDFSSLLVVRGGIRDNNDLVWVGTAANHAAKLNALNADFPTWITSRVFGRLADRAKYGGTPRRLMWEKRSWTAMGGAEIYRSNWHWRL